MKKIPLILVLTLVLASCAHAPPPSAAPVSGSPIVAAPITASAAPDQPSLPSDARPETPPVALPPIVVIMYQLELPYGSINRNDAFWKLIEEDVTGVQTQNRLAINGLRFGRAHDSDWAKFRTILDLKSALLVSSTIFKGPPGSYDRPFDMTTTLSDELLFIYDDNGLTMRSYNDCINRFSFAFQWVPHQANTLRVDLCPVVHAWRLRTDYTISDIGHSAHYLERDNFYPLHASAEVPPGDFLVIGTSTAADDPNRIGSRFMTREASAQRYEQVLILLTKEMSLVHVRRTTGPDARSIVAEPTEPND
jgi:hypothetical protein